MGVLASMPALSTCAFPQGQGKEQQLREAVLCLFCEPLPERCSRLFQLSRQQVRRLLPWLDSSGLALYFLDRVTELQMEECLPPAMLARLRQNLADNAARIHAMIEESAALQYEFQSDGISYAVLKGFSLWPLSVAKLELRSQLDLDFLITEHDAPRARQILERRGYHLHAVSGRSWEFKTNHLPGASLANLYKDMPYRSIELHIESRGRGVEPLLERLQWRTFRGLSMPVLAPADLLLGQGLHLYKHICSEFSRAAHLLEFRRHVLAYRTDPRFWEDFRAVAEKNPRASLALGVATHVVSRLVGPFAPEALSCWTSDRLPSPVELWVDLCASRSVLADFPGSKLYLLLQKELQGSGIPARRPLSRVLLPYRLPPPIVHASEDESFRQRLSRQRLQISFVSLRLRFHVVEGFRYLLESMRWRRLRNAPSQ